MQHRIVGITHYEINEYPAEEAKAVREELIEDILPPVVMVWYGHGDVYAHRTDGDVSAIADSTLVHTLAML